MGCSANRQTVRLTSTENKSYDFKELTDNCVVLIYSYECGYCLTGIPKYNKFKDELSNVENLRFVAFAEQSLEQGISDYPWTSDYLKEDLTWIKFVGYQDFYTKLWRKKKVFPEFIYFKDGKRKKTLPAPYDYELEKFKQYILDQNKK